MDRTSVDTAFKGFCLTREQQKGTQRNVTLGTNFTVVTSGPKDESRCSMTSADGNDHEGEKQNGPTAGVVPRSWQEGTEGTQSLLDRLAER